MNSGIPVHVNGSVDSTGQEFKWGNERTSKQISVINTHPTQDLSISFDGETNFFTLKANGGNLDMPLSTYGFFIKATAAAQANITFESLAAV